MITKRFPRGLYAPELLESRIATTAVFAFADVAGDTAAGMSRNAPGQ